MKLNDYELCIGMIMPCYWYSESLDHEIYYIDEQICDYKHFGLYYDDIDNINERWYKIMLYKPKGFVIKNKEDIKQCKWLVTDSYNEYINNNDNTDYEKYEWDFTNHCIKKIKYFFI